jgi:hypothetical protein
MRAIALLSAVLLSGCSVFSEPNASDDKGFVVPFEASKDLEADFLNPPDYARPRVFWWWLEGYITKQGIDDDLKAMKEAGIAGAIVFDAGSSGYYTGKLTHHNSVLRTQSGPGFMSDEWIELFNYACQIADSIDIEISMNITSGWNDGGPWVTEEHAAKKLVWSETLINNDAKDGAKVEINLTLPDGKPDSVTREKNTYKQVAVIALRLSDDYDEEATVAPLPLFKQKAVHSIAIPQTDNGLGYDWEALVKPLPDSLRGCHARLKDVIVISDKVDKNGKLSWNAPTGKYCILRFMYDLTGVKVSTASPGAGGLAIDYMSAAAMDLQFENTVKPVLKKLEASGNKGLRYLHDDSWELGAANWTPGFEEAFKKLNGYDVHRYLPVIAGKIIENHDISDRFLYDFRRTIAELICQKHYVRFRELAHSHGLGIHPESGGPHPAPIDALKNMGQGDIPMGEFWAIANTHRVTPQSRLFVKQGASAAHIYGKRFMQAEGPTTIGPHWERDPKMLKPTLDRVFCEGLNRFVVHTFTHSPREAGLPGNEYFAGTHINPNITWWKQTRAFFDWTSRNCFLLSQGLFVADVAVYYGDNVPNQVPLKHIIDGLGEGYDYDAVNTDVILNRMTVKDGRIVLPDGMSYAALVLPDRQGINIDVLKRIKQLVKNGATVIGNKPETSVGLRDYDTANKNNYGKELAVWNQPIGSVLKNKGIMPDFEYVTERKGSSLLDYIHRSDGETHIYLVVNRNGYPENANLTFRVDSMTPEFWDPLTGSISQSRVYNFVDGRTQLPLFLEPHGSMFVVFRKKADKPQNKLTNELIDSILFDSAWDVAFDPKWGGPATVKFDKLVLWNEHPSPAIKYYSGTAVYSSKFNIPKEYKPAFRFVLDLGELHNLAEVSVNGHHTGVWWQPPYNKDITECIQEGVNTLEVTIVNLWPNRLIGDCFLPETQRFTKTNVVKFTKDSSLLPSGLKGPVYLRVIRSADEIYAR